MPPRGFSCPNCHTWFEGEGNHPRCPLCGTRASPRDLLDSREHHQPVAGQAELDWGGFHVPREAPHDFELPARNAPDYETPEEHGADYEVAEEPLEYNLPEAHQQGSGYDDVHHYEAPRTYDTSSQETFPEYERSTPTAPESPRRSEGSGKGWSDRIGPAIGVLIFIAVILANVCDALSSD